MRAGKILCFALTIPAGPEEILSVFKMIKAAHEKMVALSSDQP